MRHSNSKITQFLSILMLAAIAGTVVTSMVSCKNDKKGDSDKIIDKEAVSQIGFYETFTFKEIAPDITKLFEASGDSILIKNIATYEESPCVFNAPASDTAAINAIIAKHGQDIFPTRLKLLWTLKPNIDLRFSHPGNWEDVKETEYFELIALKTDQQGKPAMSGETIVSAEAEEGYNGFDISIALDEEGGKRFSQLTAKNVGRPLAIVYNNRVISYPRVNDQIDGGHIMISGNFTEQEANDFVNTLYSTK